MFTVTISPRALEDLRWFRKAEQAAIVAAIKEQLAHQPDEATRNRKLLRPGHLTEWELRIKEARAFYDIDREASLVTLVAIGYKQRNKLFFRGEEYLP
ncbi:MAG: type II toxin-antitoxin system RelE/ParE family toxin [Gemmataceae bacterium]|nr:type II toxin-antitoxin system RelE/ParE family toxin [Gemmataceae bacterium]